MSTKEITKEGNTLYPESRKYVCERCGYIFWNRPSRNSSLYPKRCPKCRRRWSITFL